MKHVINVQYCHNKVHLHFIILLQQFTFYGSIYTVYSNI